MQKSLVAGIFLSVTLFAHVCQAEPIRFLSPMRALHMAGNWGGNQYGIKSSVSCFLDSAQPISASRVETYVSRSSYVDELGMTISNDTAQVLLTGVTIGSGATLAQAGFWVGRDTTTNEIFLQFRPSLDSSLAAIPGFAGDITFFLAADGSSGDTSQISSASGLAFDYIAAIVAHASALVQAGTFSLQPPSTFDQPAVMQALQNLAARVQATRDEYFQFLASENAEWLGISVAIFNDSISDPTVKVKYRPLSDTSPEIYTFDDADLENFITRAKHLGFKIFLTLAFEPSDINIPPSVTDPACNTPQYKVNRGFFGEPALIPGDLNQICTNPEYWWWNPNHPSHSNNVAQFWNTYTEVAVKYAILSQQLGVDMFSLGTETDMLFRTRATSTYPNHFRNELTQMVAAVRSVYTGLLTYDQLCLVLTHPEWYDGGGGTKALFQDLSLDAVGVSAYFDLAPAPVTHVLSVGELEAAWESIFERYLIPLQEANPGKPIVFTEFGYTDSVGSPFFGAQSQMGEAFVFQDENANGIDDGREQQSNIFQAFFTVNEHYNRLVRGAFIWGNIIFTDQRGWFQNQRSYSLFGKPSAQVVSNVYGYWASIYNNCSATLSDDLSLHVPVATYNGESYLTDFQFDQNTQSMTFINAGVVSDPSRFSSCTPATLSPDLRLHIPLVTFQGLSYWVDLVNSTGLSFTVTSVGQN